MPSVLCAAPTSAPSASLGEGVKIGMDPITLTALAVAAAKAAAAASAVSAGSQLATTGKVDIGQTAQAGALGGATAGVGGALSAAGSQWVTGAQQIQEASALQEGLTEVGKQAGTARGEADTATSREDRLSADKQAEVDKRRAAKAQAEADRARNAAIKAGASKGDIPQVAKTRKRIDIKPPAQIQGPGAIRSVDTSTKVPGQILPPDVGLGKPQPGRIRSLVDQFGPSVLGAGLGAVPALLAKDPSSPKIPKLQSEPNLSASNAAERERQRLRGTGRRRTNLTGGLAGSGLTGRTAASGVSRARTSLLGGSGL